MSALPAASPGVVAVAVVGAAGAGKTTVARGLAAELAERGVRVALVLDAEAGPGDALVREAQRVTPGCEVVVVDGGPSSTLPMIEVVRAAVSRVPINAPVPGAVIAYATDVDLQTGLPTFLLDEFETLGDYVVHLYMGGRHQARPRV